MRWKPTYEQIQNNKTIDLDFHCMMSVLSPEECEAVVAMASTGKRMHSKFAWGDREENNRDTDLFILSPNESNNWLFDRVATALGEINKNIYSFELDGSMSGFQLGRYSVGQGYDWHTDLGARSSRRKLSVSIQLTDPSKYEGGSHRIFSNGEPGCQRSARGRVVNCFSQLACSSCIKSSERRALEPGHLVGR